MHCSCFPIGHTNQNSMFSTENVAMQPLLSRVDFDTFQSRGSTVNNVPGKSVPPPLPSVYGPMLKYTWPWQPGWTSFLAVGWSKSLISLLFLLVQRPSGKVVIARPSGGFHFFCKALMGLYLSERKGIKGGKRMKERGGMANSITWMFLTVAMDARSYLEIGS